MRLSKVQNFMNFTSDILIIYFYFLFFLINFVIFKNFEKISKLIKIYDLPNTDIKLHKKKTSLLGGPIIFLNIFIFFLLNLFFDLIKANHFDVLYFLFLISLLFLVGLYDDLYKLNPNYKLLLIIIITTVVLILNPDLKLEIIKISFLSNEFNLSSYSMGFTVLSFALLINALNMFDGINLQLILFSFFIFLIFLLKGIFFNLVIIILIVLFFLLFLNYQNKVFLGDSGAYVIAGIMGYFFINSYNNNFYDFFFSDQIFILLMVPGIDMLRLFSSRIIKKQNPFKGDLNHLHHIIKLRFKNIITVNLILCFYYFIPFALLKLNVESYIILILFIVIYSLSIVLFNKKKKACS